MECSYACMLHSHKYLSSCMGSIASGAVGSTGKDLYGLNTLLGDAQAQVCLLLAET
jgi:hypothetical protein